MGRLMHRFPMIGFRRKGGFVRPILRNLEKQLQKIIRKGVVKFLEDPTLKISVNPGMLKEFLGPPTFKAERAFKGVGVVTGLAWTAMGGATLPLEVTCIHTINRGFKLTGQLGDVMKESAESAATAGHDRRVDINRPSATCRWHS